MYEGDDNFRVLPSFGMAVKFNAELPFSFADVVPNFSPAKLLQGEEYLEVRSFPIPTEATLIVYPRLIEVLDKGEATVLTFSCNIKNKTTGKDLFYTESTAFIRGSGGFGGVSKGQDRGASTRNHKPPQRKPDVVVEQKTTESQAAMYRLTGDRNPLHIDPNFAQMGGFKKPILHGLCSLGIAVKAVEDSYGQIKNVKVRFAGVVVPGETLVTEQWKEGKLVIFQTKVKETGKLCIAGAGAELRDGGDVKAKL